LALIVTHALRGSFGGGGRQIAQNNHPQHHLQQ
jgi:hypothetical protein